MGTPTVQRGDGIVAVSDMNALSPLQTRQADLVLLACKYFGNTLPRAQTSLLRHKEGKPCSIFRYHVC